MTSEASRPRRRLRSATVHLGAMTVLALGLAGCNGGFDDDDDCGRTGVRKVSSQVGPGLPAPLLAAEPAARAGAAAAEPASPAPADAALPERGGFGTQVAYGCGG